MFALQKITIVGCGLLGGAFALALRRAGFTGKITGTGGKRGPAVALENGIIDEIETAFDAPQICDADLIFLAAPIGGILDFLRTQSQWIKPGAIVTDAGSTKSEICAIAKAHVPETVLFIGGHPMAGSENTGVEYAHASLFDGATWALMEDATHLPALEFLVGLIARLGARPLLTTPAAHDKAVAQISHLPQLLASALAGTLNHQNEILPRRLAANGWRDMTRLAGSNWSVWRDILMTNQPNVTAALATLIQDLQGLQDALEQRDFQSVRALFEAGNESTQQQRALYLRDFELSKTR